MYCFHVILIILLHKSFDLLRKFLSAWWRIVVASTNNMELNYLEPLWTNGSPSLRELKPSHRVLPLKRRPPKIGNFASGIVTDLRTRRLAEKGNVARCNIRASR